MASVSFSNVHVVATYATPHATSAWAYLTGGPWRRVQSTSPDGTTNMFLLLNAAKAGGRPVSGSYDRTSGALQALYML